MDARIRPAEDDGADRRCLDGVTISVYTHIVLSAIADVDVRPWSRLLRAVADETRLRIVAMLSHGELCVCHIEAALELPQPTVSRHLGILRAADVVDTRRDGSWVYYRLAKQEPAEVQALLDELVRGFVGRRGMRSDLVRIKKATGPAACG